MLKNGTLASPAIALAKRVFPVPGGPIKRTPLGILAPIAVNFSGCLRKVTTSCNSSFASSIPATSSKPIPVLDSIWKRARDLPKLMAWPEILAERRITMTTKPIRIATIKTWVNRLTKAELSAVCRIPQLTWLLLSTSTSSGLFLNSLTVFGSLLAGWFFSVTFAFCSIGSISTLATWPLLISLTSSP